MYTASIPFARPGAPGIRFRNKQILETNFDTYEIPRFSWVPEIETVLVELESKPFETQPVDVPKGAASS